MFMMRKLYRISRFCQSCAFALSVLGNHFVDINEMVDLGCDIFTVLREIYKYADNSRGYDLSVKKLKWCAYLLIRWMVCIKKQL